MRREWAGLIAAALLTLSGCRSPKTLQLERGPDDALLIASGDRAGEVARVELVRPGARLAADPDGVIYAWRLRPSELSWPDGRRLDPAGLALAAASLARAPAPASSCGRCLVPALAPPQIVEAGDRCPPPPFATSIALDVSSIDEEPLDPAALERARDQVRLDWPGPCACSLEPLGLARELELCPLPERAPAIARGVAIAADGSALILARTPAGRELSLIATDGAASRPTAISLPPFSTFLGAFPPGADQRFLLAVSGGNVTGTELLEPLELRVVSGGTSSAAIGVDRVLSDPPLEVGPRAIRRIEPDAIHVLGWTTVVMGNLHTVSPAAVRCGFTGGVAVCRQEPIEEGCALEEVFADARTLPGGAAVGFATRLTMLTRARPGAGWTCAGNLSGVEIGDYRLDGTLGALEADSSHLFLCAQGRREIGDAVFEVGTVLLRAPLPAVGTELPSFRPIHWAPNAGACDPFVEEGDRRLIRFSDGSVIAIDPSGEVVGSYRVAGSGLLLGPEIFAEVPHPIAAFSEAGRWQAALSAGEVYRRRAGEPFVRVFGALDPELAPRAALAPAGDERIAAFRGPRAPMLIGRAAGSADCEGVELSSAVVDGHPTDPGDVATAALAEGNGRFLVAGRRRGSDAPWLRWIDLDGGRVLSERIAEELAGDRIDGGAFVAPGAAVLFGASGRLWTLGGDGRARPLEVRWDDPRTPLVEAEPPAIPSPRQWRSTGARAGVAWIAGAGALVRITSDGDGGLRAEGFAPSALEATPRANRLAPSELAAMRVICPDQAALIERETLASADGRSTRRLFFTELRQPGMDCPAPPSSPGLALCPFAGPDARIDQGTDAVALVGAPSRLALLLESGVWIFRSSGLADPQLSPVTAMSSGDLAVAGGWSLLEAVLTR